MGRLLCRAILRKAQTCPHVKWYRSRFGWLCHVGGSGNQIQVHWVKVQHLNHWTTAASFVYSLISIFHVLNLNREFTFISGSTGILNVSDASQPPPGCPGSWAVKRVRCLFLLSVEATKRKLEDTEDEVKTLKRRHVNSVKVLALSLSPF